MQHSPFLKAADRGRGVEAKRRGEGGKVNPLLQPFRHDAPAKLGGGGVDHAFAGVAVAGGKLVLERPLLGP